MLLDIDTITVRSWSSFTDECSSVCVCVCVCVCVFDCDRYLQVDAIYKSLIRQWVFRLLSRNLDKYDEGSLDEGTCESTHARV